MVNSSSNCNTLGAHCDFLGEGLGGGFPSEGLSGAVGMGFGIGSVGSGAGRAGGHLTGAGGGVTAGVRFVLGVEVVGW